MRSAQAIDRTLHSPSGSPARIGERFKRVGRWFGNRVVRSSTVVGDIVRAELPSTSVAALYWFRGSLTRAERDTGFIEKSWPTFSVNPGTQAIQLFHDVALPPATWGRIFNLRGVRQDAQLFQTGVLLERPAMAASTRARG